MSLSKIPLTLTHPHPRALGKRPPRCDHRTLKLSNYLLPAVLPPSPPPESSWVVDCTHITPWTMALNDQLGDCVIAAMAHMVQQWTFYVQEKRLSGATTVIGDSIILKAYEDVGGYRPNDPSTDNGCVMLDALNYWRKKGLGGHKILAYMSVDPHDERQWKTAISLFGSVIAGFALPLSAQDQTAWTVADGGAHGDGAPGTWGGHCVPIMAYSPMSLTCVTWGAPLKMSHNFFGVYCDELYVALSQDWLDSKGVSASGLDLATLKRDLAAL